MLPRFRIRPPYNDCAWGEHAVFILDAAPADLTWAQIWPSSALAGEKTLLCCIPLAKPLSPGSSLCDMTLARGEGDINKQNSTSLRNNPRKIPRAGVGDGGGIWLINPPIPEALQRINVRGRACPGHLLSGRSPGEIKTGDKKVTAKSCVNTHFTFK